MWLLFVAPQKCCKVRVLDKVYQPAIAITDRGGRVLAQTRSEKTKKHNHHIYDDQTIENMIRYYNVEEKTLTHF